MRGTHEADEQAHEHAPPRSVRLEGSTVGERAAVETLRLEALVEADVGHADTEPGHEARNGYESASVSVPGRFNSRQG